MRRLDAGRPEAEGRRAGARERRRVVPAVEAGRLALVAERAGAAERARHQRVVGRHLRRHHVVRPLELERVLGEPGVVGDRRREAVDDLGLDRPARALAVHVLRQVRHVGGDGAGGRDGDHPGPAVDDGRDDVARGEQRVLVVGARPPLLAERAHPVQHGDHLLDGVDRAAVAPVRLRHLGVAGAAGDGDRRRHRAAAAHPGVERGGLGGDAGVGLDAVLHAACSRRRRTTPRRCWCRRRRRRPDGRPGGATPPGRSPGRRSRPSCRWSRGRTGSRRAPRATNGSLVHLSRGSTSTASMWPLSRMLRPPPEPRRTAASCGRPAKSRPAGRNRSPSPVGSGSHRSASAPSASRRAASSRCSFSSSRAGSPGRRAVVSQATSSAVRPTSSSLASRTAWTMRSSSADCSSTTGLLHRRTAAAREVYDGGAGATPRFYDVPARPVRAADHQEGAWAT